MMTLHTCLVVAVAVAVIVALSPTFILAFEVDALPGWLGELNQPGKVSSKSSSSSSLTEPRVIKLSWKPRAFLYKNFLSEAECDHIIRIAKPKLERSEVVSEGGKVETDDIRTSWGMFIDPGQDSVISDIEERIATWTFLPIENQEAMQVLRYQNGQKYESHHDFFDEDDKSNMQGGHRYATVLMYLSNVELGGETVFPDSEKDVVEKDGTWTECGKRGVAARPRKGDALLFFSLHPNATTDIASLHAGCPVIVGEKWSATKWIHVNNFYNTKDSSGSDKDQCLDEDDTCEQWAKDGECEKNPDYMKSSCRLSCKECELELKPFPSDSNQ